MTRFFTAINCLLLFISSKGQIVSGPMLGQVELRDAKLWIEVAPSVKKVQLVYKEKAGAAKTIDHKGTLGQEFNPITFTVGGLEPATTYTYRFLVDGKFVNQFGEFTTKDMYRGDQLLLLPNDAYRR